MAPITVVALRLPGYKYLLRCALMPISHSSFVHLGFLSPAPNSLVMDDKRGSKHPRYPSTEGSPSSSDSKTPPPALSGSPPPLESPSEISLRCPCSPVFEQGGPSRNIPMIELSSSLEDEGFFVDDSQDVEFIQQLL
jgi:hypothetical protein